MAACKLSEIRLFKREVGFFEGQSAIGKVVFGSGGCFLAAGFGKSLSDICADPQIDEYSEITRYSEYYSVRLTSESSIPAN